MIERRPPPWKHIRRFLSGSDARKGTLSVFDQGIVSATNFFTGVIIGRSCTKEEFGLFTLGFSLVLLIVGIQYNLTSYPFTVFSQRLRGKELSFYRGSTLIQQIVFSIVFALGLFIFSLFLSGDPLASVLRIMSFAIVLILLKEFIRQLSYANLDVGIVLLLDTAAGVLQIGCLLIVSALKILNSTSAYCVLGLSSGLTAMVWIFFHRRLFSLQIASARKDFLNNVAFGKWVLASGLLYSIGMNSYPWILKALQGTGSAGIWAACIGIASLGNPLLLGIQNFLGPRLVHAYRENDMFKMKRFVIKVSVFFSFCMLTFALFLLMFGGKLLDLLYGSQYSGHGTIVSLIGFSLVISSFGFSSAHSLYILNRADLDFKSNFLVLILVFLLGIPLVKIFGLDGAAYSLVFSGLMLTMLKYGAYTSISRRKIREMSGQTS